MTSKERLFSMFKAIDFREPKTWISLFPILAIALFLITSLLRLGYPYQLTWMEGPVVDHARWILEGNSLYGPPSIEFTPYLYPPFYFYLCAAFMKLFGVSLLIPRLLSLAGSVVVLILLWRLIKKETGSTFYALLGAGTYAAFSPLVRFYLDQARVDALFITFLLLGIYILRTSSHKYSVYLAAFVFFLAIYTKQQAFPIIALIGVALLVENFKTCLKFSLTFGGLSLAAFALFQWSSDGWFLFYIFELPRTHGMLPQLMHLMFTDLLFNTPFLFLLAPVLFFISGTAGKKKSSLFKDRLYLVLFIGSLFTSWASRSHWGGAENVLLPLLLSIALLAPISLFRLEEKLAAKYPGGRLFTVILVLLAAQFILLSYNMSGFLPQEKHYRMNEEFIQLIKEFKGNVLIPELGYIPTMAGKKTHSHKTAIFDIVGRTPENKMMDIKNKVHRMYQKAIRRKEFSAVIIRKDPFYTLKLNRYYKKVFQFKKSHSLFVHGFGISEWNVYVPR